LAPRLWWGHLLVLVAVVAASLLGFWQVEAWQERRSAEARDLTSVEPVPLSDLMGPDDPFPGAEVGQPVEVAGEWLPEGRVFIEGREHEGADGYWLVDVLLLADGAAIPVVQGWLESPELTGTLDERAELVGWLQPSEGTGATDDDPDDDVLPQLRTADLVQLVDVDLYGAYVVARDGIGDLPAGDLTALPEASRFTALRNLLYGIEWWVFGGFAVFLWWRWVRDEIGDEVVVGPADDPADDPADTVAT
jgi:surfeit locus 1 family protein